MKRLQPYITWMGQLPGHSFGPRWASALGGRLQLKPGFLLFILSFAWTLPPVPHGHASISPRPPFLPLSGYPPPSTMRLINVDTMCFEEFYEDCTPPYAILSHTWDGDEEVSFEEMKDTMASSSSDSAPAKKGFTKIKETCRLALMVQPRIHYAWVDTCCIDKSSSAELTESINSMFKWYASSTVCFVHLADLSPDVDFKQGIQQCKWITRGWTLQEVIAPARVRFYDAEWKFRGKKKDLYKELADATGIPPRLFQMYTKVSSYPIAQRMSWASRRKTTRVEDTAYCLLGILEVNMPLIYGEGIMAFRRLQEEVIKRNNDLTIFAWNPPGDADGPATCSMLATSSAAFLNSAHVDIREMQEISPEFVLTNKGLRLEETLLIDLSSRRPANDGGLPQAQEPEGNHYLLTVGRSAHNRDITFNVGLQKIGPGLFLRLAKPLRTCTGVQRRRFYLTHLSTFSILTGTAPPDSRIIAKFRRDGDQVAFPVHIRNAIPEGIWNDGENFFYGGSSRPIRAITFDKVLGGHTFEVAVVLNRVGCKSTGLGPTCYIFDARKYRTLSKYLFRRRLNDNSLHWSDLEVDFPDVLPLPTEIEFTAGVKRFRLTPRSQREEVNIYGSRVPVFRLYLDIEERSRDGTGWGPAAQTARADGGGEDGVEDGG